MEESALVLVAHPIIADESSLGRLLEEIDAHAASEEVDDAFFTWTSKACSHDGQDSNGRKLAFYRELLNGASLQLDLPTDRTRPPVFNAEGDFVEMEVTAAVQKAAENLASAEMTDLGIIVVAALAACLGRITRQSEIVLGIATDLRPAGFESAVGPFENTAVLRVRLEDSPTSRALIGQVRDSLAALEPQRNPVSRFRAEQYQGAGNPFEIQVCPARRCLRLTGRPPKLPETNAHREALDPDRARDRDVETEEVPRARRTPPVPVPGLRTAGMPEVDASVVSPHEQSSRQIERPGRSSSLRQMQDGLHVLQPDGTIRPGKPAADLEDDPAPQRRVER